VPTAHATVATARPSRYLSQLCRHVDQLSRHTGHRRHPRAGDPGHTSPGPDARVTWSDTAGAIDLGWGRCTLQTDGDALVLHAEAHDATDLQRLQTLLSARLHQIGRRDHLTVEWKPTVMPTSPPATAGPPDTTGAWRRGTRRRTVAVVAVGVLFVVLHLGLGATVITSDSWAGRALGVVLAVVVVKLLASIVLGRRLVHHHRRRPAPMTPTTPTTASDQSGA